MTHPPVKKNKKNAQLYKKTQPNSLVNFDRPKVTKTQYLKGKNICNYHHLG